MNHDAPDRLPMRSKKITHFVGEHPVTDPGWWLFHATRHGALVRVLIMATPFGFSVIVSSALDDSHARDAANDAMPDAFTDGESHRLERLWALLEAHEVQPIITEEPGHLEAYLRLHHQLAGIERERERLRSEA